MSGWIKWEKDLETDPRFVRLVRSVRNTCVTPALQGAISGNAVTSLTMGCLLKFWSYADTHIRKDDMLDLGFEDIDELVGLPGFARSIPDDWLISRGENCVELPGYQEHNGVEAKKRALSQKRMENKRERDRHADVTHERNDSDVGASPDQTRPDQTNNSPPPARASEDVPRGTGVIDGGTNLTRSAEDVWGGLLEDWRRDVPEVNQPKCAEWFIYLEAKGKRLGADQRLLQARFLAQQGTFEDQGLVVDHCKANDYKRLIPITDIRGKQRGPPNGAQRKRWTPGDDDAKH